MSWLHNRTSDLMICPMRQGNVVGCDHQPQPTTQSPHQTACKEAHISVWCATFSFVKHLRGRNQRETRGLGCGPPDKVRDRQNGLMTTHQSLVLTQWDRYSFLSMVKDIWSYCQIWFSQNRLVQQDYTACCLWSRTSNTWPCCQLWFFDNNVFMPFWLWSTTAADLALLSDVVLRQQCLYALLTMVNDHSTPDPVVRCGS